IARLRAHPGQVAADRTRRLPPRTLTAPAPGSLRGRAGPPFVGFRQRGDVELLHRQHRRHGAPGLLGVLRLQHLEHDVGHDLPRETVPVLQPAALHFLTASRKLLPEVVDFFLILAVHDQGDGLGELEVGPAVQRRESLPVELELDGHDRALGAPGRLRCLLVVAGGADDPGILEDRHVVLRGLLGLAVEPQERGDFLRPGHGYLLGWSSTSLSSRPRRFERRGSYVARRGAARPWRTSGRLPSLARRVSSGRPASTPSTTRTASAAALRAASLSP